LKNKVPLYVFFLLGIAAIFLICFYPSQIPMPWFDEGWTLAAARTWVEKGLCARLLNDEPISATGMAWNFPVTAPIAFSFYIFGVGIWQGRLPSTLFTIYSILLIYLIARRIYNEKVAIVSMVILLLGFPFPLTDGRQAIGEPAMIFYLLAGYYVFWGAIEKHSIVNIGMSMLLWGMALTSKHQTFPFWAVSMLALILFAGIRRDTFIFWTSICVALGTVMAWQGMLQFQKFLEIDLPLYGAPMKGLLSVTGWVTIWSLRVLALKELASFASPLIFGLGYALFLEHSTCKIERNGGTIFYQWLTYWMLTASWLLWFATLAMPRDRYLYPSAFLGSIFIAVLICKLTYGLRFSHVVYLAGTAIRNHHFTIDGLFSVSCIILLAYMSTVVIQNYVYAMPSNDSEKIAKYLNQVTPSDSLIETYDSELLFLVGRQFHYPPDQVQVELNRRKFLNQSVDIHYNPMLAHPDYVVIGPYSDMWKLYDSVVMQNDTWKLIFETANYKIYKYVLQTQ